MYKIRPDLFRLLPFPILFVIEIVSFFKVKMILRYFYISEVEINKVIFCFCL